MMPLLWRYLLGHYIKTFVLCVAAFIAILLTMRLDEIAYFATLGPEAMHILLYAMQQIPYILPIALPVAALIASILLVQQLSAAHELTAMRACGFALRDILAPILIAAAFLSAANFYIISELSTASHLNAGQLKNELRTINPLFLLHNKHVMQMKGFYFDTMGPSRVGEFAQDIVFFSPNKHTSRLNLLVAKHLQASPEVFSGNQVTILTSQQDPEFEKENLIVENIHEATTTINDFTQMMEKKIWSINNDHLRLPMLLVRIQEARSTLAQARLMGSKEEIKMAVRDLNRGYTEILRRVSVALAVFSFTLMGLAFGISITRNRSNKGIIIVTALGSVFLIAFFAAKSFDYALASASALYLAPHALIWITSFWTLHKTAHGIE